MYNSLVILSALLLLLSTRLTLATENATENATEEAIGENSTENAIQSLIDNAKTSGLSVAYDIESRSLPLFFNPLATALAKMTTFGAIKLGVLYSLTMYLLATFFPHALKAVGLSSGLLITRSGRSMDTLDSLTHLLSSAPDNLAKYLNIPENECRYRAVCETSYYISTKTKALSDLMKQISSAFFLNLANPYAKAWVNGIMAIDCATAYATCTESPFRTFFKRLALMRR